MYLLDTHALLWFFSGDDNLPSAIRDIIETEEKLYASIGSFWEIAIKCGIGKLQIPISISEMMEQCEQMQIHILPIRAEELETVQSLERIHGDPFDRLIICQAMKNDLTILTRDEIIPKYGVPTLW